MLAEAAEGRRPSAAQAYVPTQVTPAARSTRAVQRHRARSNSPAAGNPYRQLSRTTPARTAPYAHGSATRGDQADPARPHVDPAPPAAPAAPPKRRRPPLRHRRPGRPRPRSPRRRGTAAVVCSGGTRSCWPAAVPPATCTSRTAQRRYEQPTTRSPADSRRHPRQLGAGRRTPRASASSCPRAGSGRPDGTPGRLHARQRRALRPHRRRHHAGLRDPYTHQLDLEESCRQAARLQAAAAWTRTPSATGRAPCGSSPGRRWRTTRTPGPRRATRQSVSSAVTASSTRSTCRPRRPTGPRRASSSTRCCGAGGRAECGRP